jgi:hypothetical protein
VLVMLRKRSFIAVINRFHGRFCGGLHIELVVSSVPIHIMRSWV